MYNMRWAVLIEDSSCLLGTCKVAILAAEEHPRSGGEIVIMFGFDELPNCLSDKSRAASDEYSRIAFARDGVV